MSKEEKIIIEGKFKTSPVFIAIYIVAIVLMGILTIVSFFTLPFSYVWEYRSQIVLIEVVLLVFIVIYFAIILASVKNARCILTETKIEGKFPSLSFKQKYSIRLCKIKDVDTEYHLGVGALAIDIDPNLGETKPSSKKPTRIVIKNLDNAEEMLDVINEIMKNGAQSLSTKVSQKMTDTLNNAMSPNASITPPPVPTTKYYVAKDGQPIGPYDVETLRGMVANGSFKSDSLVWKEGMNNWEKANTQSDLKGLFPPEMPK